MICRQRKSCELDGGQTSGRSGYELAASYGGPPPAMLANGANKGREHTICARTRVGVAKLLLVCQSPVGLWKSPQCCAPEMRAPNQSSRFPMSIRLPICGDGSSKATVIVASVGVVVLGRWSPMPLQMAIVVACSGAGETYASLVAGPTVPHRFPQRPWCGDGPTTARRQTARWMVAN